MMTPHRKKILIVDDTEDIRDVLSLLFRLRGCEPIVAQNGRQAIEQARQCAPDLILMDICMPVMDGYQATMCIHDVPWLKEVPVIAMSAHWQKDWSSKAMAAGCVECVPKPIEPKALDQIISRYVHDC
jgi:CheY-like chemotaxis protein